MSRIAAVFAVLVLVSGAAFAQSPQGLPAVNLGFTTFVDGAPPAGPGLYFQEYLQYYGAERLIDGSGAAAPLPGTDLDVWASLSQFIYMWDYDLGGGAKPALDVLIPVVSADLDFSAPTGLTANSGLGDILIGPAIQFAPIMGDNGPLFVHRVEAQFILPTGDYDPDSVVNPGSNFFSFSPYWAGTAFLGPKTSASVRAHYLWNATNDDPLTATGAASTRAGDAFHMNFGVSHEIWPRNSQDSGCAEPSGCAVFGCGESAGGPKGPKVRVGLNGYYLQQTTDVEVNGAAVPGFRERAFGVGPGVLVSFSEKQHIFVNAYWEDEVRNRPEGFRLTMRYTVKF